MSGLTDYAQNKIQDAWRRGQPLAAPATFFYALFTASRGVRANSTAYALNDTATVLVGGKYSFYKCTTAGTSAAAQPGTFLGALGEAVTDGTAVFTEQSAALDAGTAFAEVSGGSYARVGIAASMANYAGTQGAGTTTVSTGTNGTTSNNVVVQFPTPSAQWHPTGGAIVGYAEFDAGNAGNPLSWTLLSAPKNVNNGDQGPSIAIGAATYQLGS